jgi:hypothetical protein
MSPLNVLAFKFALALLAVSCVVFPNSLKITASVALVAAALLGAPRLLARFGRDRVVLGWLLISVVSMAYVVVGQLRGAPAEAAAQVILIYCVFPILWIAAIGRLLAENPLSEVVRWLTHLGVACCATVALFYYLFFTAGPDAVLFFIEEPNIDTATEGYIGATMYVFGSLIFLSCGFVAAFDFRTARWPDYAILLLFVAVAFIAGRSALQLALFLGFALNLTRLALDDGRRIAPTLVKGGILVIPALVFLATRLEAFDLDPLALLAPLVEKVMTAGGEGRMQQFDALLRGIAQHWGLGAGHGIGVYYAVSDQHPWRYEMVWLASIHRVGFVGAALYAAPFLLTMARATRRLFLRTITEDELFLFGGFIGAFVASNTNPYVEALVFQWMYALPIVYFLAPRRGSLNKSAAATTPAGATHSKGMQVT